MPKQHKHPTVGEDEIVGGGEVGSFVGCGCAVVTASVGSCILKEKYDHMLSVLDI